MFIQEGKCGGRAHIPQKRLTEPESLARGATELECGMHDVRIQLQLEGHALGEVGVAAAEGADWQDAELELALVAPASMRIPLMLEMLGHT